jgi:beta-galactosidase
MLYMLRPGFTARLTQFVENGGTLVLTYLSGLVDQSDLCFIGESPLRKLLGLWVEETDALFAHDVQTLNPILENELDLRGSYPIIHFADILHLDGAEALAHYGHDFYAGQPALTVNEVGNGRCYYIAARPDPQFLQDFYTALSSQLSLLRAIPTPLPTSVTAQVRQNGNQQYLFLMNFQPAPQTIHLESASYQDALSNDNVQGELELEGYGLRVLYKETA